jgi:hypothetical protein
MIQERIVPWVYVKDVAAQLGGAVSPERRLCSDFALVVLIQFRFDAARMPKI